MMTRSAFPVSSEEDRGAVSPADDAIDKVEISGGGGGDADGGEAVAEPRAGASYLPLVSQDDEDDGGDALSPAPAEPAPVLGMQQWAFTSLANSLGDMGLRSTSTAPCCLHASAGIPKATEGRGGFKSQSRSLPPSAPLLFCH